MFLGKVVGELWATRKVADLEGKRLLVIEALDERRDPAAPKVTPVIAADPIGAGVGERVIVAFGKAARVALGGIEKGFCLLYVAIRYGASDHALEDHPLGGPHR